MKDDSWAKLTIDTMVVVKTKRRGEDMRGSTFFMSCRCEGAPRNDPGRWCIIHRTDALLRADGEVGKYDNMPLNFQ